MIVDHKELIELYVSGLSITDISKKSSYSKSTLRLIFVNAGVIRTRGESLKLASKKGKLGLGNKGKKRVFTDEWKSNMSKAKKGKGLGICKKPSGYIEFTMGENKGRSQHVILMEGAIGRRLYSNECVHHVNGVRDDNRIENLELMTRSEHARHHALENNESRTRNIKGQYK